VVDGTVAKDFGCFRKGETRDSEADWRGCFCGEVEPIRETKNNNNIIIMSSSSRPHLLANAQYKVHEVKPLQSKQFKDDVHVAKDLLDKACWQVQPIMKKRKWSVPVVAEMPPKNTGPIGVNYNAGKRITLMLRKPTKYGGGKDGKTFFDLDHIILVLLHELTHIVRGPHDDAFWKLLDELKEEYDQLKKEGKGGTGEGFDAKSVGKLGTRGFGGAWDKQKLGATPRESARNAALKRLEQHKKMIPIGGVKLGGGDAVRPDVDPREAARRAAEQRMRETMDFSKKFGLDLDSEIVAIDLVSSSDSEEEEKNERGKKGNVVVIDLLSSDSDDEEEKEDLKENTKNDTKMTGKGHLLSLNAKRKCLCCSSPGKFCQKI